MSTVLFESGEHRCIAFNDLVRGDDGVQANQFLIQHGGQSALLDPGGALLYNPLILALAQYAKPTGIDYILCSHQDPDIIGSVDKWLLYSEATIVCSELWGRFVPHVVPGYLKNAGRERYKLIPDRGGYIELGSARINLIPAHFMHSVGNFSFWDERSRILFSGDVGASMIASGEPFGKAGAYAMQGRGAAFVEHISGSASGIIGLPLCETLRLLRAAGWPGGPHTP